MARIPECWFGYRLEIPRIICFDWRAEMEFLRIYVHAAGVFPDVESL